MEGMCRADFIFAAYIPLLSLFERFDYLMFLISKEEADEIRKCCPDVHIVRTMKQRSHRGKYFCEETASAIRALKRMRAVSDDLTDE